MSLSEQIKKITVAHYPILCLGFVIGVRYIWKERVVLKGLVKLVEITKLNVV